MKIQTWSVDKMLRKAIHQRFIQLLLNPNGTVPVRREVASSSSGSVMALSDSGECSLRFMLSRSSWMATRGFFSETPESQKSGDT
jgi:hypothetical protein